MLSGTVYSQNEYYEALFITKNFEPWNSTTKSEIV